MKKLILIITILSLALCQDLKAKKSVATAEDIINSLFGWKNKTHPPSHTKNITNKTKPFFPKNDTNKTRPHFPPKPHFPPRPYFPNKTNGTNITLQNLFEQMINF